MLPGAAISLPSSASALPGTGLPLLGLRLLVPGSAFARSNAALLVVVLRSPLLVLPCWWELVLRYLAAAGPGLKAGHHV